MSKEHSCWNRKPLITVLMLAVMAGGFAVSAAAQNGERGKSAATWASGAVSGDSSISVSDDEESSVVEGDVTLPELSKKNDFKVSPAALARTITDRGVNTLNATQKSAFKASYDSKSGRIKILYGSQSRNYSSGSENVARGFLADAHDVLGLQQNLSDLKTMRVDETAEKNHVRFQQTYNGVPVVGAGVIVHASKAGQVTMVQNSYIEGIQPANDDVLAEAAAKGIAMDDLKATADAGTVLGAGKQEKQLIQLKGNRHYIWKVSIPTINPYGLWVYHIDSEDGSILYKKNEIVSLKTGTGLAYTSNANYLLSKISTVPLKNLYGPTDPYENGYLWGPHTNIIDFDYNDPFSYNFRFFYNPLLQPNEFHNTQAYYALENTRDWWRKNFLNRYITYYDLNSGNNPFNWRLPVVTNVDDMCNAFYSPNLLGDGRPGMAYGNENSCAYGSADLVLDYDVVRHEYTHAMMDWAGFSEQFGGYVDWYGRAMGEGNADWFSYLHHPKDPRVGTVAWAWSDEGYLRTLDNTRMYPWDVNVPGYGYPEEHYTGEIWGGYLYDLYRVLGKSALRYVAQSFYYFDPADGFQSYEPDFWDAISAQMIAEFDLKGNLNTSKKAWGAMTSRGINGFLEQTYKSSNYFKTGVPGQDDRYAWVWNFPVNKSIVTKGNLLLSNDTHEYLVKTLNSSMKLTATVTGVMYGLNMPKIALYNTKGTMITAPISSSGSAVTLMVPSLPPDTYVIKVSGQTFTPGKGYYNFKISIL